VRAQISPELQRCEEKRNVEDIVEVPAASPGVLGAALSVTSVMAAPTQKSLP